MNEQAYGNVLLMILNGTTPDDRSTRLANSIELSYTPPKEGEDVHKLKIVHHRYELDKGIVKTIATALQRVYGKHHKVYVGQNRPEWAMVDERRTAILKWKIATISNLHTLPLHEQELVKQHIKKLPKLKKKKVKQKQLI